ncbi:chemotaxis protein [Thiomicrospira sp. XS5]|uniref:methyl-accepting chemotaxis protein n=1 Tax=Thiomicrospira sp. XS5 TaxID=1775636 RepID=UPI00074A6E2D|nr:methyl-accepting chemotaxis protein [Thiomicrospira sp. XS5]KUJ73945.1 chemotaxis protein [Thiomicrospira sp. XS5]
MFLWNTKKPSILRRMFTAFIAFGVFMGISFPVFAHLFVEWKPGMLGWFVLSCILAGISIGLFNYWLLNIMLLKRLKRIGEVANAISNNDVSHKCSLVSHDFIGDMANSFNLMSGNLRSMISRIAEVSTKLNQSAEQMVHVTHETQNSVNQQQQGTEMVVSAIDNMTSTVTEMTNNSFAASEAAEKANSATQDGSKVVLDTVAAIQSLANEVEQTAHAIQNLKEDSENIATVLDVIKDIAEQTNLLALNAAIEAARAGENGRGFAVVADEVRTLASKTQESAKKIETMIANLQNAAQQAVDIMNQGREQANNSVTKAHEAGHSLEYIASAVKTITDMNIQIANSAETQRNQTDVVNDSVNQIRETAGTVAQGAAKTDQASKEVDLFAVQLSELIGQFKTR